MNKNIIIVLAGGFLVAILVAMIVQSTLRGSSKKEEIAQKRVEILVAAKDLKTGTDIKQGDLKWQIWPEETLFAGAIIRDGEQLPAEVAKGKLLRPLVAGQPVHMTLLVEEGSGDFLSANVQKGMRAVGISVNSYVLADRLIRPGDFVDVLLTYKVRVNTRDNPDAQSLVSTYATETVIENIRVLAIDKEDTKAVDEAEEGEDKTKKIKAAKKATLTLEVSPEAAEVLVLATEMGEIGIALRSLGDNTAPTGDRATTDVAMSRVLTNLSNMRTTSSGVRIYNGIQMQEVRARNVKNNSDMDFSLEENLDEEDVVTEATIKVDPALLQQIIDEDFEE